MKSNEIHALLEADPQKEFALRPHRTHTGDRAFVQVSGLRLKTAGYWYYTTSTNLRTGEWEKVAPEDMPLAYVKSRDLCTVEEAQEQICQWENESKGILNEGKQIRRIVGLLERLGVAAEKRHLDLVIHDLSAFEQLLEKMLFDPD